ncbi:hypothetical protein ANCCAN_08203 [Ancylostoma caninum]|uniref:EGF-like domain-containing protein n=1 Tax=Ancylostoma caninum TaxID=29170 RepID=A0A368GMZ8_ANCCA|nr:hypothetical protein ANCCAN_08203 [Ancylostoma caninum]
MEDGLQPSLCMPTILLRRILSSHPSLRQRQTSNREICDCFYGYTGPLCEYVVKLPPDGEESSSSYSNHPRQIFPIKHSDNDDAIHPSIEHLDNCDSCSSNSSWIVFLLLHLLLVITGVVCVSLALICYYRQKTMKTRHRQLAKTFLLSANHTIFPNLRLKTDSELYLLPPNYEEATTIPCQQQIYENPVSDLRRSTADSTLHITHKDSTPDNTLHVTTKEEVVHLHV